MGTTSAFRPSKAVSLRGDAVAIVRELDWSASMEFLGKVGTHARDLLGPLTAAGAELPAIKQHLLAEAPTLVVNVRELGDFLLTHALEDPQVMNGRGVTETLGVLQAAIEINLSPAVLEAAGALGKAVANVLGTKTTTIPT